MYFVVVTSLFFFFKQKTAYEMRISDWSSDVCSSDLVKPQTSQNYQAGFVYHGSHISLDADYYYIDFNNKFATEKVGSNTVYYNQGGAVYKGVEGQEIGRASCRERVCQYV